MMFPYPGTGSTQPLNGEKLFTWPLFKTYVIRIKNAYHSMRLASFRFVVAIHSPAREWEGTMRLIEIAVVITYSLATTCALNGFSTLVMTEREGWLKESGKTDRRTDKRVSHSLTLSLCKQSPLPRHPPSSFQSLNDFRLTLRLQRADSPPAPFVPSSKDYVLQ